MKATISFGNPVAGTAFTVAVLLFGWWIGARWGHTLTAGWMLLFATIFLILHDAIILALLIMALTKIASSSKNQEHKSMRPVADLPGCRRDEPHASSIDPQAPSAIRDRLGHQGLHQNLDLDTEIEALEFSVRSYGYLKDAGIHTVRALVQFTEEDLIHAGFTPRMIDEIRDTLGAIGLQPGMHFED
jgi:hypothetical protein